jgi:hypothetical protein
MEEQGLSALKEVDQQAMKDQFLSKKMKLDKLAHKSVEKLSRQVAGLNLVRLRGVLPKKLKEFNEYKKLRKIEYYDSSDLKR